MIFKFQQGGAIPFVTYKPVIVTGGEQQVQSSGTKSSSSGGIGSKEIFELLSKEKLLPNDFRRIAVQLQDFQTTPSNTAGMESNYLQILNGLQNAMYNKEEYSKAFNTVKENKGLNEVAITLSGELMCVNKEGDYKLLSPDELSNNKEYIPLTNSQLLSFRANDDDLAFNSMIFNTISNGIGMEKVEELVFNVIDKLGTTSIEKEGYSNIQLQQGVQLIKELATKGLLNSDSMTPKDLYKNKLVDKNQMLQMELALNYIYKALPNNAKSLLLVKCNGNEKEVGNLIYSLITSTMDVDLTQGMDLQKPGTSSSSSGSSDKMNTALAFQTDQGAETSIVLKNGTQDTLLLNGYQMVAKNNNGDQLGLTTLDKLITSETGESLDFESIYMGDQFIEIGSSKNVVINANKMVKLWLPYDQESASRGIIRPNLDYLKKLEEVREDIRKKGATTEEEINKIYEDHELPPFIKNGEPDLRYYKQFAVLNATANDLAFQCNLTDLKTNTTLKRVENEKTEANYWDLTHDTKKDGEYDYESWIERDYNITVQGMIYIPVNTNPIIGAFAGNSKPSLDTLNEYREKYQQQQRISNANIAGQL